MKTEQGGEKMEYKLNAEQQKAVEATEGFVRVQARARPARSHIALRF